MCKLRKELPPVNLAAVTCDSWSGMTGKLVPGSIIVCSMGSSTARVVKITGVCRSPPLPDGVGRRRLAALSGLPDSAARRQNFFGSYCMCSTTIYFIHFEYTEYFIGSIPYNHFRSLRISKFVIFPSIVITRMRHRVSFVVFWRCMWNKLYGSYLARYFIIWMICGPMLHKTYTTCHISYFCGSALDWVTYQSLGVQWSYCDKAIIPKYNRYTRMASSIQYRVEMKSV